MVFAAQFSIHIKGDTFHGVDGVHADAALETGSGLLSEETQHLDFFDQIIGTAVEVTKTVDSFAGQMGDGGHQVLMGRVMGQGVGHLDRI